VRSWLALRNFYRNRTPSLPTRSVISKMAPSFSLARLAPWITERLARPLTARRQSQGEIGTERTALHGAVLFSFQPAVWVGPSAGYADVVAYRSTGRAVVLIRSWGGSLGYSSPR